MHNSPFLGNECVSRICGKSFSLSTFTMSILEKDWLVHLALGPFLDADDEDEVELYIEALKVIKGSSEDAHAYEERLNLLTSEESLATGVLLKALREGGITLEPERCAAAFALALGKTPPISFKGGTTVRPRASNDTPWPLTLTPFYSAILHTGARHFAVQEGACWRRSRQSA
jgi:hypothetical protein